MSSKDSFLTDSAIYLNYVAMLRTAQKNPSKKHIISSRTDVEDIQDLIALAS